MCAMCAKKNQIKVDRFIIPFRVYGTSPKHIVCVNGAQQTMAVWRSFITYFSDDFSVVTFDFPGQGRAQIVKGGAGVSFEEQLEILRQVILEASGGTSVYLFGASWGGIIAAGVAAIYPALVKKLVLASFGIKPSTELSRVIKDGQKLIATGRGNELGHLITSRFGQHISEVYRKSILQQFEGMNEERFLSFYEHSRFVAQIKDINDYVPLSKIAAETLIISGKHDTIIDLDDLGVIARHIPHCKTITIEDAGHFLHFEKPSILHFYREFYESILPLAAASSV